MYKLMIVTDSSDTKSYFEQYDGWMFNGFKLPHFRYSKETLIDGFLKHHVDGIAIELSSAEETDKVRNFLNDEHPLVPIFKISKNPDEQASIFNDLRKLLDKINADYSDDTLTSEQRFDIVRNKWFNKLLNGTIQNYSELIDKNLLLRTNILLSEPCTLVDLTIPAGEEFLSAEWRYGAQRLEVALRNLFGKNVCGANIIITVTSPTEAKVLFTETINSNDKCKEAIEGKNEDLILYLNETIDDVKQYLGLEVQINNISRLPNLEAVINSLKREDC